MIKYSKNPFVGYTHRHRITFKKFDGLDITADVYANSSNFKELKSKLLESLENKVMEIQQEFCRTKEQDDSDKELLDLI